MVELLEKLQSQDERLKNIENLLSLSKSVLNIDEVKYLKAIDETQQEDNNLIKLSFENSEYGKIKASYLYLV